MNKTVNINLAGIVLHIDEEAFEILNNYLNSLKNHFKNEEGADEILKDIEGRIAEIFTERLAKKEAISLTDVEIVIAIMGNPNQYDDEIAEEEPAQEQYKEDDLRAGKRKRIFRDADDRMVAGVCGGLANYFDIDPLWLRLIFLILLFTGGGFLIYIIFWFAIPEAKTTAEKLEMKGEKVNISNIEKNIKDELGSLKYKMDELASHPKTKKYGKKARTITQNITDFFISLFSGIIKFIGSCLGMFAIGIGVLFLLFISTIFISPEGADVVFNHGFISDYIFENESLSSNLSYGLLLFFSIPIIAVILTGLRLLFGTKIHRNYKIGMLILWIISWILIGSDFASKDSGSIRYDMNTESEILDIKQDTLYIYIQEKERIKPFKRTKRGYRMLPNSLPFENTNITLDIKRSNTDKFTLSKSSTSFYFQKKHKEKKRWFKTNVSNKIDTVNEAKVIEKKDENKKIKYDYNLTKEDLILNDFFTIEKNNKWNVKEMGLSLNIPTGKTIYLDHSLNDMIYDIKNVDDMWGYDMLGHYWKMEKEGLTCVSCK